jgi:FixJ family two-component response regulator
VIITRSLVSIVDDDESVRESLPGLLRELGFAAQAFSSAETFLASAPPIIVVMELSL